MKQIHTIHEDFEKMQVVELSHRKMKSSWRRNFRGKSDTSTASLREKERKLGNKQLWIQD